MPVVLAMSVGSPMAGRYLDRLGSKAVILAGAATLTVGMLLLGLVSQSLPLFILAGAVVGLGLSALLGAPMRYIMLNEVPSQDRGAAQGMLTIFTGIGQLMSGAAIGAVVASSGGGIGGYRTAYLVVAAVALAMTLLGLGLKSRAAEMEAARAHAADAARPA